MALSALSSEALPVFISNTCSDTSSPNVLARKVAYHQILFPSVEANLSFVAILPKLDGETSDDLELSQLLVLTWARSFMAHHAYEFARDCRSLGELE